MTVTDPAQDPLSGDLRPLGAPLTPSPESPERSQGLRRAHRASTEPAAEAPSAPQATPVQTVEATLARHGIHGPGLAEAIVRDLAAADPGPPGRRRAIAMPDLGDQVREITDDPEAYITETRRLARERKGEVGT